MSEELNCSEGARMLIERMQTHPKDFKADGRFARITDSILGKLPVGFSDLSDRDDDALSAAYDKYILEPQLTEYVVDEIFNGAKRREEELKEYSSKYAHGLAASMMNTKNQLAANVLQGGVYNPAQGQAGWGTTAIQPGTLTAVSRFDENKSLREIGDKILAKLKRKRK